MAILVDEAIWTWRERRWAHLVSDASLDELHAFASALGLRYASFQGDHYDIPAERRERAIELGAQAVTGRQLVRRMRVGGQRRPRSGHGHWEQVASFPPAALDTFGGLLDSLGAGRLGRVIDRALSVFSAVDAAIVLARPAEHELLVRGDGPLADLDDLVGNVDVLRVTTDPEWGHVLELVTRR